MAYKLVRYEDRDLLKLSGRKRTWPGAKQAWRRIDPSGRMMGDVLGLASEPDPHGMMPLLETVMEHGSPLTPASLDSARERCGSQLAVLPPETRRLRAPRPYDVRKSPSLRRLTEQATADLRDREVHPWQ
jgi:nicotinate phosphoribosyltransferase